MGYVARIKRGGRVLVDFNEAPFALADDFVPPGLAQAPYYGGAPELRGQVQIGSSIGNNDWTFFVHIDGDSSGLIEGALDHINSVFEQYADDDDNPLIFEWLPHEYVARAPIYGTWNRPRQAQIVFGQAHKPPRYWSADRYGFLSDVPISLVLQPVTGEWIKLGHSSGGVLPDRIGLPANAPARGLQVPEATTNKMTNPIFGYATWDNGWTAGANVLAELNTDLAFVLFGANSARLTAEATNNNTAFYQSINVGNTNTHAFVCYAIKSDLSAITTTDARIYYNTNLTTTWTHIGGGIYRGTATAAGINASTATGINVYTLGTVIYLLGFQVEEKSYSTPLCYGDLLGCAWTGTAHASTSTRTAARCKIDITNHPRIGYTWVVAWKASQAAADIPGTLRLLYEEVNNYRISFDASTNVWVYSDGTNVTNSAAQTFAMDDVIILHVVVAAGGYQIYVNGAASGSPQATVVPMASAPTWLHIGSNDSATPGEHCNGTFLGVQPYDYAMTAAEIAADYANIAARVVAGIRLDWLPNWWTKDGDGVVDNCDDSSRDNYGVALDIPGTLPAETKYDLAPSDIYAETWLLLSPQEQFYVPANNFYYDASGSADANASGGAYEDMTSSYDYVVITPSNKAGWRGDVHFFIRSFVDGGPVYYNGFISYISTVSAGLLIPRTDTYTAPDDTNYRLYYLGKLGWSNPLAELQDIHVGVEHATGQAQFDYALIVPGKLGKISGKLTDGRLYLHGLAAYEVRTNYTRIQYAGDILDLEPERYNHLFVLQGDYDVNPTITSVATVNIWVRPRWHSL